MGTKGLCAYTVVSGADNNQITTPAAGAPAPYVAAVVPQPAVATGIDPAIPPPPLPSAVVATSHHSSDMSFRIERWFSTTERARCHDSKAQKIDRALQIYLFQRGLFQKTTWKAACQEA